jgi:hypothetical protein
MGQELILLELGIGFNTPVVIRFPFERLAAEREETTLITRSEAAGLTRSVTTIIASGVVSRTYDISWGTPVCLSMKYSGRPFLSNQELQKVTSTDRM